MSWSKEQDPIVTSAPVAAFAWSTDRLFAVCNNLVFVYDGSSWRSISNGIPENEQLNAISSPIIVNDQAYIFCGGKQVYTMLYPELTVWTRHPFMPSGTNITAIGPCQPGSGNYYNGPFVGVIPNVDNAAFSNSLYLLSGINGSSSCPQYPKNIDSIPKAIFNRYGSNSWVVVSFDYGVWESTDGGATFNERGLRDLNLLAATSIHYGNNSYVFVGSENGLYRALEGSSEWAAVGPALVLKNKNAMCNAVCAVGSRLFASWELYGVFYTSDQGNNWLPVNDGLPSSFFANPHSFGVLGNKLFGSIRNKQGGAEIYKLDITQLECSSTIVDSSSSSSGS